MLLGVWFSSGECRTALVFPQVRFGGVQSGLGYGRLALLRPTRTTTMDTFRNNLGESLPGFMLRIAGIKDAQRGWCGRYIDGHSVSPKNACRKLGRTSPLHLKTGWGGNSTAQCKENLLSRPDSLTRSGCDVPIVFSSQPCAYGAPCWWTKYPENI